MSSCLNKGWPTFRASGLTQGRLGATGGFADIINVVPHMIYKNVSLRWRNFLEAFRLLVCIGGTVFAGAIKPTEPSPSHFGTEQHCSGLWSHHLCGKKKIALFITETFISCFKCDLFSFFLLWQISGGALVTRVDTRHKSSFVLSCIFTQMLFIFYPWRSPDSRWELDRVPG